MRLRPIGRCLPVATLLLAACNDSTGPETESRLMVAPAEVALVPDGEFRLEVRAPSEDTAEPLDPVEWSSSDPEVATVDAEGRVTAVDEGTAWIIASAEGAADSAEVRVTFLTFSSISTGRQHACGLTTDGEAWCWGTGRTLGDSVGDTTGLPVRVAGGHRFREIGASEAHTCALTMDGRAFCWGSVALGIEPGCVGGICGTVETSLVPVEVEGGLRFDSLDVGWMKTCGLTAEGVAYCWGTGALGNEEGMSDTPVRVNTDVSFIQISAGAIHACGLTAEGEIYCWGINTHAEVGIDPEAGGSPTPVRATVVADQRFRAVMATVHDVTCGIRTDDVLLCWGHNDTGQLGRGFQSNAEPSPDTPAGLGPVASVSGGAFHLCAVSPEGNGYCWGGTTVLWGQLGHGVFETSDVPVQVAEVSNFAWIDVGFSTATCALTTDAIAYCWGRIFGTDSSARTNVPTRVPGQRP